MALHMSTTAAGAAGASGVARRASRQRAAGRGSNALVSVVLLATAFAVPATASAPAPAPAQRTYHHFPTLPRDERGAAVLPRQLRDDELLKVTVDGPNARRLGGEDHKNAKAPNARRLDYENQNDYNVITNPSVTPIFIGDNWDVYSRDRVRSFIDGLGSSDWWKITTLYDGPSGSVPATITRNFDIWLKDADVKATNVKFGNLKNAALNISGGVADWVDDLVMNGKITAWPGASTLFLVLADDRIMTIDHCLVHCGWHQHGEHSFGNQKYYVAWVGNPKFCGDQGWGNTCGYDPTHAPNDGGVFGPYLDAMFSVIAHELTEWTTDPDGYQWFKTSNGKDNGMENADLCAWQFGSSFFNACNGKSGNAMVGSHAYTLQLNMNPNTLSCAVAAATQTPKTSCTASPTRTSSKSRSTTPTATRSRSSTPSHTPTATHSFGASASETATASYTASATSTPSMTPSATKSCFWTPPPRPSLPPGYVTFPPLSVVGVCPMCGNDPVNGITDPGPRYDTFRGANDVYTLSSGGLSVTPLRAFSLSLTTRFRLNSGLLLGGSLGRLSGNLRQRRLAAAPTAKPTCYPVTGTTAVPWPGGDGFTSVCSTTSPTSVIALFPKRYFASDVFWDQSADAVPLPNDNRVLRGLAPVAIARLGRRLYGVLRGRCALSVCPGASAVSLVLRTRKAVPVWTTPNSTSYAGTLTFNGGAVKAMAPYSPETDSDQPQAAWASPGWFFAVAPAASTARHQVVFVSNDALAAFVAMPPEAQPLQDATSGEALFPSDGYVVVWEAPTSNAIVSLTTHPGLADALVVGTTAPTRVLGQSTSYLTLLTPPGAVAGPGAQWVVADDSSGALGWGGVNPVELPSSSVLAESASGSGRRLSALSPLLSLQSSAIMPSVGSFRPFSNCVKWVIMTAAGFVDSTTGSTYTGLLSFVGGGVNGGSWSVLPNTTDTGNAAYSAVVSAPQRRWVASASPTAVPSGATPPPSASGAPTPPPTATRTKSKGAAPTPTRTSPPKNIAPVWSWSDIAVVRVGPTTRGPFAPKNTSYPVFIDQYSYLTSNQSSPKYTYAMPLVRVESASDGETDGNDDVEFFPTANAVCTLPGPDTVLSPGVSLGSVPGTGCANGHGQTALDGTELAFVCHQAMEGSTPELWSVAPRVLVSLPQSGDVTTTQLDPIGDAASTSSASMCSTSAGGATFYGRRWMGGEDGMSVADVSYDLFEPAPTPQPEMQHVVRAPGFGSVAAGYTGTVVTFASSPTAVYRQTSPYSFSGWTALAGVGGRGQSLRGFALASYPASFSAVLWACDTKAGLRGWSTSWTLLSSPLTSTWTTLRGGVAVPVADGGCQGMFGRNEGAQFVVYVTSTGPATGRAGGTNALYRFNTATSTMTLLALSPPGAAFRGVFAAPVTPPSPTATASRSRAPTPSRSATRKIK